MPYTAGLAADLSADRYGAVLSKHRHTRRFVRPIKETGKRPRPDRMGLGLFFCKVCRKIMPPGGARVLKSAHHDAAVVFGGVALSGASRQGRVAAPSVCCATACILLAAAPTATPCFRRWRRSSLLLLTRGGFGIPENFTSSPEAPLGRGAVEQSETERLRQAEPYPLYLLCARPSLPSMMSFAAAAMSGQRSARALASSGGNLPSTQSAKS